MPLSTSILCKYCRLKGLLLDDIRGMQELFAFPYHIVQQVKFTHPEHLNFRYLFSFFVEFHPVMVNSGRLLRNSLDTEKFIY